MIFNVCVAYLCGWVVADAASSLPWWAKVAGGCALYFFLQLIRELLP